MKAWKNHVHQSSCAANLHHRCPLEPHVLPVPCLTVLSTSGFSALEDAKKETKESLLEMKIRLCAVDGTMSDFMHHGWLNHATVRMSRRPFPPTPHSFLVFQNRILHSHAYFLSVQ